MWQGGAGGESRDKLSWRTFSLVQRAAESTSSCKGNNVAAHSTAFPSPLRCLPQQDTEFRRLAPGVLEGVSSWEEVS